MTGTRTSASNATPQIPHLEPLEVASGVVFGRRRTPRPDLPEPLPGRLREVLERLLVPALSRPPCLVAFSGGRDSSAMLATATHVARREGLPDPVPITLRYEDHPRTWENEWQELIIKHLGLREWEVLPVKWELDATGEIAGRALKRFGMYWPPNAHSMIPMLQAAREGTLVTGNGGDELLSGWSGGRFALFRRGRVLPSRRELKTSAVSLLPYRARVAVWRSRRQPRLSWLRPTAAREVHLAWASKQSARLESWEEALKWLLDSRYLELALGIFDALAADSGARLSQPFLDPRLVLAAARNEARGGPKSRSASMTAQFGDLLPAEALRRATKASFTEVLWGPRSKAFANDWDGSGLDPSLVDPQALRRAWTEGNWPDFRAFTPLQSAWLWDARHA